MATPIDATTSAGWKAARPFFKVSGGDFDLPDIVSIDAEYEPGCIVISLVRRHPDHSIVCREGPYHEGSQWVLASALQPFMPKATAEELARQVLARAHALGLPHKE